MAKLELDKTTREHLSRLLSQHLRKTLDLDLEPFDSIDLLDFLAKTMGPYFYNKALLDSQAVIKDRLEQIMDAVDAIEMPLPR